MVWLLLLHVVAFLLWMKFVAWEVGVNARLIKADGSADTLKAGFHSRRTWLRFWWWLGLTTLPAVVAWLRIDLPAALVGFGALGLLLGCYFVRTFNPLLNVAMELDYKGRFYVSPSPTAALYPDRYIWQHVRAHDADQRTDAELQDLANEVAHLWLNVALVVGSAAEVGYFAFLLFHA